MHYFVVVDVLAATRFSGVPSVVVCSDLTAALLMLSCGLFVLP